MQIYNSLTRKKEEFIPNEEGKVKMDILEKYLTYIGYDVKRTMNITDVGHLSGDFDNGKDKMVEEAKKENKGVLEIAEFYTDAFKKDFLSLNLKWPEIVIPATSCISQYILMINKLLEKGFAYISNGNVYFDTSKLDNYYVFSNHNSEELYVGVRDSVEEDMGKKNKTDFALWFTKSKFDGQALKWDSPWGEGYPGWHIECSGISIKYLGEYLDIHCGGVDNIFPHHTNEIAQSEAYLGHKWCNYWFHVEHLNLKEGKMGKSEGNAITLSTLKEKGYTPLIYKYFCLGSYYRKELVFSYEGLDGAKNSYNKLKNKIKSLKEVGEIDNDKVLEFQSKFRESLDNDLNTSLALTVLYDVLKSDLNDKTKKYLIEDFDKVLGLDLLGEDDIEGELIDYINSKIEERNKAKAEKNYSLADEIRNELLEKGIELMDTREGTKYKIN